MVSGGFGRVAAGGVAGSRCGRVPWSCVTLRDRERERERLMNEWAAWKLVQRVVSGRLP